MAGSNPTEFLTWIRGNSQPSAPNPRAAAVIPVPVPWFERRDPPPIWMEPGMQQLPMADQVAVWDAFTDLLIETAMATGRHFHDIFFPPHLRGSSTVIERNTTFARQRAITADEVAAAKSHAIARAGTQSGQEYRFFAAHLMTDSDGRILPGIVITQALSDSAAKARISSITVDRTEGVFANSRSDADWLVSFFGGPSPNRINIPEISGRGAPGFFWHYHPKYNENAHIWFI